MAAAEASAAAEAAEIDAVRAVLSSIARDESEHAALAYRFVRWAITVGGKPVRESARVGFDAAIGRIRGEPRAEISEDGAVWLRHGRLPRRQRSELRARVIECVLTPSARELFA
ncbi:MAG: hypothetical protein ACOY0T_40620 [Myxococcota bacterium]